MAKQTIAPTLNSRLASACNCAYGINDQTGIYHPPAIFNDAVNWQSAPKAFAAASSPGGKLINAALVGLNQDGIIVAFRGTIPLAWTVPSVEDWWQDIVDSDPIPAPPIVGKVHSGFWHALQSIWLDVLAEIKQLQAANPGAGIYITGHSKGGPLASISAAWLLLKDHIQATAVVTFASPHPGDQTFIGHYPTSVPVTRFENYLDLVPMLPPSKAFFNDFSFIADTWVGKEFCKWFPGICKALQNASQWDYAPLGELRFVTSAGHVVGEGDPSANVDYRLVQILLTLFDIDAEYSTLTELEAQSPNTLSHSGLSKIGAAHCIACKANTPTDFCAGGYMTGAGGDPICPEISQATGDTCD